MKTIFTALFVLAATVLGHAQNSDSLTFLKADWSVEKIGRGIRLRQFHFTGEQKLFGTDQYVSILEIRKKPGYRFILADELGEINRASKFAKDSGAIVAVNGTFYNMRPPYNCVCYYKKNGEERYASTETMSQRDNGALAIDGKGRIRLYAAEKEGFGTRPEQRDWAKWLQEPSVVCGGPMILSGGDAMQLRESSFNTDRHPRTVIALDGRKVYIIAVDGRAKGMADGMRMDELLSIVRYLGAEDALNLDGGGSTTMYVSGRNREGIVNHPSDNGKFDREGERRIVNALLLVKNRKK